jgi:hypothetical protein
MVFGLSLARGGSADPGRIVELRVSASQQSPGAADVLSTRIYEALGAVLTRACHLYRSD